MEVKGKAKCYIIKALNNSIIIISYQLSVLSCSHHVFPQNSVTTLLFIRLNHKNTTVLIQHAGRWLKDRLLTHVSELTRTRHLSDGQCVDRTQHLQPHMINTYNSTSAD